VGVHSGHGGKVFLAVALIDNCCSRSLIHKGLAITLGLHRQDNIYLASICGSTNGTKMPTYRLKCVKSSRDTTRLDQEHVLWNCSIPSLVPSQVCLRERTVFSGLDVEHTTLPWEGSRRISTRKFRIFESAHG
jgi:hypothetical protein